MKTKKQSRWMMLLVVVGGLLGGCASRPEPSSPAQQSSYEGPNAPPPMAYPAGQSMSQPTPDGAYRKEAAPSQDRPGLATQWGETRTSYIRSTTFYRADFEHPSATAALWYNDAEGSRAQAAAEGYRRFDRGELPVAQSGIVISLRDEQGRTLPGYQVDGKTFAVGEAGVRYTIWLENRTPARFEIVASVDGLDVIDGKPASFGKRGYLLNPHASLEIDGFRQSEATVAAFRFGSVRNSYAARKGDDRNVGVIGLAIFHERGFSMWPWDPQEIERRRNANPFPGQFATPPLSWRAARRRPGYDAPVRVALIYPPTCDPTAPYLAVPMLTGYLRAHGVEVLPVDANIEAYDELLEPGPLGQVRDRLEEKLARLEQKASLTHVEQLAYGALWGARGDAHAAPEGIARAKATLRSEVDFYDPARYGAAVATVEAALRAVSAAYGPLRLDFTAYRTPFSLLSLAEIEADAQPHRDPFDRYITETLAPRLAAAKVDVVGLSVCFPGQTQPAYSFALKLKKLLPGVHFTVGGPGVTQMLIRLKGTALAKALGPFDSAVVFEGESTLLSLARALDEKRSLRELTNVVIRDPLQGARYLAGHGMEDLRELPAPDFDGLPLDRYLSPRLVLPYDPTRGCYWGKCTFCHYGLAEVGTASYRERAVPAMVEHLRALSERHKTDTFYLSQDSVAPKTLLKLAQGLIDAGVSLRWATDLKAEKYLTEERAEVLRKGGAIACAIGVESGNDRVLSMIDKGAPVAVVAGVMERLSEAGVAVEAMCFTDFPTETRAEALDTLRMIDRMRDHVALFIVGQFGLTHGALVAQEPEKFGLSELWQLEGDELGLGLFFSEKKPPKSDDDRARVERDLDRLSRGWWLRHYPWAGALSTAHTILYYQRFGKDVFRELAARVKPDAVLGRRPRQATASFDLEQVERAQEHEQAIWGEIVYERRKVSRAIYQKLAAQAPSLRQRPRSYTFTAGEQPAPGKTPGRRPSGSPNATSR